MGSFVVTTKSKCPSCTGHGAVWTGQGDAYQCGVCNGQGNILVNACPECGRVFSFNTEVDREEWLYGNDATRTRMCKHDCNNY